MKEKPLFVIKDRAVDSYNMPFAQGSTQEAVRNFRDQVQDDPKTNSIAKHPDDYDLYIVGNYDPDLGEITPITPPQLVARGKDLVNNVRSSPTAMYQE